jgi:uncharacterized iron-regulated membrane protein
MAAKKTPKKDDDDAVPSAVKPVAKKAAKKAAKVAKKVPAKVEGQEGGARKTAARKSEAKVAVKPLPDVIARAAYLNYRRRVEQNLPGDSHGDWLAAERQLRMAE